MRFRAVPARLRARQGVLGRRARLAIELLRARRVRLRRGVAALKNQTPREGRFALLAQRHVFFESLRLQPFGRRVP